ncbi:hypothetical protein EYF80_006634 [Liparis tanakae]|uniref:Uncharacterized protein n=1 Tax=Liparis tanakae TaxID=230148 RepID=A0A4Z2IZ44_9TELE|nr:hypothetical protein EYF80_006634 [Liparis tanakae]
MHHQCTIQVTSEMEEGVSTLKKPEEMLLVKMLSSSSHHTVEMGKGFGKTKTGCHTCSTFKSRRPCGASSCAPITTIPNWDLGSSPVTRGCRLSDFDHGRVSQILSAERLSVISRDPQLRRKGNGNRTEAYLYGDIHRAFVRTVIQLHTHDSDFDGVARLVA